MSTSRKTPRLTPRQAKMRDTVAYLKEYMRTYDEQPGYLDYSDTTLIDDVLYGLGVAFDREHVGASGYGVFKDRLREHLGIARPQPAAPVWIAASDTLPDSIPVIATNGTDVREAICERGIWIVSGVARMLNVTHWMPLPEPPTQGDKA